MSLSNLKNIYYKDRLMSYEYFFKIELRLCDLRGFTNKIKQFIDYCV